MSNNTSAHRAPSNHRKPNRRRPSGRSTIYGMAAVTAVILVGAVLIIVKVTSGSAPSSTTPDSTALAPATASTLAHIPASVLTSVGMPNSLEAPQVVQARPAILKDNGKPSIVYIGAEFCPFCAAERWPLVVALSRFGTFSGLRATHSSSTDEFPNTSTLSFYGSTYSSHYLSFTSVELESNRPSGSAYTSLQTPTTAENMLISTYDMPPYTSSAGTIPFIDFGNQYVQTGSTYSPQVLAGLSQASIAKNLSDPTSSIAQNVDGTANLMTAAICHITGDKPASVCSSVASSGSSS